MLAAALVTAPAATHRARREPAVRLLAAAPGGRPYVFTAVTHNIRHGARDDGAVDLEGIAAALRSAQADLVGLQEVDVGQFRSGLADQARRLAAALGMEAVFGPARERGLGLYGNALLTRHPVRWWRVIPLPGDLEPRSALIARVETPGGPVTVAVTHLGLSAADRGRQAAALAAALAELPGPFLLLGDWNADLEASELAPLRARFRPAPLAPAPDGETRTVRAPGGGYYAAPDRILVSPGLAALDGQVLGEALSDHRPVAARLALAAGG